MIIVFVASYAAKRAGLLRSDDGGALLRVVFYLGYPPLIFLSILRVDVDASFLRLCLVAPVVIGASLLVVLLLRRSLLRHIDRRTFGPFLAGAAVMNTGFLLPFVERTAGPEGVARLVIIDTFVGVTAFSVVYAALVGIGHERADPGFVLRKLVQSGPLWGLVAAVVVKLAGVTPPVVIMDSFEVAARIVGTTLLMALGLKFELRVRRPRLLLLSLALRFGLGAVFGAIFIRLAGLDGIDARVAMFASIAPIAYSAITFAEMERLDVRFAASQVSMGILIAIAASPLTVQLLL
nr:AEC family transporter [Phytoactinopolyspora endophytica]